LILEGKWNMQLVGMVDLEKAICQGQLRNKKEDKKHSKKKSSNRFYVDAEAWNCSFY
jgi:hypothetical protein